ncbi:MAG TPA: hypothetical protein VE402_06365 [Candidatus Angelobacter sp.]|nr:hypothetical protein [Candidatus Angelobacter sp.]
MRLSNNHTLALAALAVVLLLAVSVRAGQKAGEKPKPPAGSAQTPAAQTPAAVTPTSGAAATPHHHDYGTPSKAADGSAQRVVGKTMTIVGEVMDPACFLEAGVKSIGPGHYQCAIDCARSGQTLAIYDRDQDRIYFIAGELPGKNPNDPLMPYIHKKVDVLGTVYHRADAYGIVILKVALHDDKAGGTAAGAPAGK